MNSNSDNPRSNDHPLRDVPGLASELVQTLEGRWLTTAEQVLGATATTEGREGLRSCLKLEEPALAEFLERLREIVGPEAAMALEEASPGGALGLLTSDDQTARADGGGRSHGDGDEKSSPQQ